MDDCCGLCCICVACFGCLTAVFRYMPSQAVWHACKCKGCPRANAEDDFDPMAKPAQNAMFTADGERIQRGEPYAAAVPMSTHSHSHSASQHLNLQPNDDGDPFATRPPSTVDAHPPLDHPAALRAGISSDSEKPLGYRVEPGSGNRVSQLDAAGGEQPR